MQIARLQSCELCDVVGLLIFDVIAHVFQDSTHQLSVDQLAGPVMQRKDDGILGFDCHGGV